MQNIIFNIHVIFLLAARCQNNSVSEEETEVPEECEFPDFTPFLARFMSDGMESLRDNALMKGLIERMFDYEQDLALVETEISGQPNRMELVFNYIDLSFQLFPTSSDEAYRTHAKFLHSLRRYYDKKASLNPDHNETIRDVF